MRFITKRFFRLRAALVLGLFVGTAIAAHLTLDRFNKHALSAAETGMAIDEAGAALTKLMFGLNKLADAEGAQSVELARDTLKRAATDLGTARARLAMALDKGLTTSRVQGLARSSSLDPIGLLSQAQRIGAALAKPGAAHGRGARNVTKAGLDIAERALPIFRSMKDAEQVARASAADRLRIASFAIITSMIAIAVGTALFVFRPLERQIFAAQEEIEARRRNAERASQAKTEFLATMSHEIRTPMNGVLGMTDLLRASHLEPRQQEMAEVIARSGKALIQIIDGVLDLAKIESGRLVLTCEPFDLRDVATDVTALFAGAAASKDVAVRLAVDASLQTRRVGDAGAVRQMLSNLVGNAVKFTDKGEVVIRLAPDEEGGVDMSVRDTGIGVPPAARAMIFESFAQVDSSITRRHGGTGLGLAIVRRLAEAMGGAVSLDSAPGRGSEFKLSLPLPAALEAPMASKTPSTHVEDAAAVSLAGLRVLVAEDNEINRMVSMAMLDRLGCQATLVDDGAKAVEISARDAFDVILMDISMPVLDGHAATRAIRAREMASAHPVRTPIFALSAHALDAERLLALEEGMDGFLTKPIALDALASALAPVAADRAQVSDLAERRQA